ncbi:MAG: AAA family ATPase [Nitrospirae bacterium]|nr:AAA family ATPase [Nitrospirota bacterium]
MYTDFFGLETKPFELVPNPDFLFQSRTHRRALLYLDYGIREKSGFILLTGEIGTGKTTLVRNLIRNVGRNITLAKVFNTRVTSDQLIAMINDDYGLDISGRDKTAMLRDLYNFLIAQYAAGYQTALIIDEAQNLDGNLLEEIRLLSNLETDNAKLIQIILVGQPELRRTLAHPRLRQLRQRISISANIMPLSRQEEEKYIFHRLEIAGNRNAVTFAPGVLDYIHRSSRGTPRITNRICDFLLLTAFTERTKDITIDIAEEVIGELDIETVCWRDETPWQTSSESTVDKDFLIKQLYDRTSKLEDEIGAINRGRGASRGNASDVSRIPEETRNDNHSVVDSDRDVSSRYSEPVTAGKSPVEDKMRRFEEEMAELRSTTATIAENVGGIKSSSKGILKRLFQR